MSVETCGEVIDTIDVKINYRIIELFSGGLYSSPNKAFEELVCNSYDAFADKVAVHVPSDLSVDGAHIWVCDNGESMDQQGLKDLWNIGKSAKRENPNLDKKRLQIGRFGIGKLATYILARKLSYICKKDGKFLATTMDYSGITDDKEKLQLDEREISEEDVKNVLDTYINNSASQKMPFELFGSNAAEAWTFSLLTELKPKALEIKEGRLKWILSTALPLNPGFSLHYNGNKVQSSKINKPIRKTWVLGKDDHAAEGLDVASPREENGAFFVDFDNLKGVYGKIDLYEDSLVDGSKASELGRSHGIFLIVRDRLVNLDDPLLGMSAFSHGPFNRSRIEIHADELDENLTSTRESIKESLPLNQLKEYLKKKINNEVKKYHFDEQNRIDREQSISYRLSQTSLTLSKRPLYAFAKNFYDGKIINPFLIEKPPLDKKVALLKNLKREMSSDETIIKEIEWKILDSSDPIGKLDLITGKLKINFLHPYIANYSDAYRDTLPVQFLVIAEVLTEAHLYELGIDESNVNAIMKRRDNTLRKLSLSDREGVTAVAQLLKDSKADSTGLEDAVHRAFLSLGFESRKIGGNGEPDGIANAVLGFSSSDQNENYSLTFDAKSTGKDKIQAGTTKLSAIKRHQTSYNADFAIVVSINYAGAKNPDSAVSKEAKLQKVTVITIPDLCHLLLLSVPKQIGLSKLRDLFETCHTPAEVSEWINNVESKKVNTGPIKEILDVIYEIQSTDTEPPEIGVVRREVNKLTGRNISKKELQSIIESLNVFVPGFVEIEGERVGINGHPRKIQTVINHTIGKIPDELRSLYEATYSFEDL
ncbi:ATP-binding protein [Methanococcoides sp. AM1]|uniref:ATP-binding protein n=1 Tax=Methanococcoides sp. AM1 TaxID=1201011 RepID=UPI001083AB02|nr:ATP-binding protein [Methanococcoides sp. AM1]